MIQVQASDAKTHLPSLLDKVEHGETIIITRHGKPIARLVPDPEQRKTDFAKSMEILKELRKRVKPVTREEIMAWKHEGHKY